MLLRQTSFTRAKVYVLSRNSRLGTIRLKVSLCVLSVSIWFAGWSCSALNICLGIRFTLSLYHAYCFELLVVIGSGYFVGMQTYGCVLLLNNISLPSKVF